MFNNIYPVILCGGSGTRLWPLSRKSLPKQFLNLFGDNKKSLLQQTQQRLVGLENIENDIRESLSTWLPYVNTNNLIVVQDDRNSNQVLISLEYSTTLEPETLIVPSKLP